jgi:hypothetical protein
MELLDLADELLLEIIDWCCNLKCVLYYITERSTTKE